MSSTSTSSYYSECTWLSSFLSKPEFQLLLTTVPLTYFQESLSLYGLEQEIDYFKEALSLILNNQYDCDESETDKVERSATILYAKAHQRYIRTAAALDEVKTAFQNGNYGTCPRNSCQNQHMLPFGASNDPGKSILRCYCPVCGQLYKLYQANADYYIDGCFFGSDLVGIFLATYPEFTRYPKPAAYVPKVYGFELYKNMKGKAK
ncbi:Casein_kinase II beta chain [Hexamita inflata]|uniref:Casein kinase II subunit beta n=1 Tax=Hexamita inflata TaxID=28002 RepID=A0AA86NXV8_9EUKA|nr:Casein kinase II beta chain [Hexamita inflata]CAI9928058.1 Casein kinase II beta chain [Hexamita inflata]CAI9930037.1 Casein kinase II beta chain [Hexamita inflata]